MQLTDPDLSPSFDAVVMLTVSDWKTEPRSNRYHYATRFAARWPVVFVQPDLLDGYAFEPSGTEGVELLHVSTEFDCEQSAAIAMALSERRILRPLLWIYSPHYIDTVERVYAPLCVLHATEDYFSPELRRQQQVSFYERLSRLLPRLDQLVAVSQGVLASYRQQGGYRGEALVLENGCDYKLIRRVVEGVETLQRDSSSPLAFYQGGINYRLDFPLLLELAASMHDWRFEFCGCVYNPGPLWEQLLALPNVRYLGELSHDEVMARAACATVGLMPFCKTAFIQKVSLPLKAFEYAACGLPVVGVPIDSLARWPELFLTATDAVGFGVQMQQARELRFEVDAVRQRLAIASQQDYDTRYCRLQSELDRLLVREPLRPSPKLNVLVLYGAASTHTSTVHEYVASFSRFSTHHVVFADAVRDAPTLYDMGHFDVIVVNYSVRLTYHDYIAPEVVLGLKASGAFKILTIQDDYDTVERTRRWIDELGIHVVLTCIPDGQADRVYPRERFPSTEFISVLTGYVPQVLEREHPWRPLRERAITLGYRGRRLPFVYGRLAQEKFEIGRRMRELCELRGIDCDIEWEEDKRIYGDSWYEFIGNCRAMLASESGSNAFDFVGSLHLRANALMEERPDITYEEFHEQILNGVDGEIRMNQVSARVFEAIALGTPLVLFEGEYSGVVRPYEHYLPLRKDFGNVEEIFRALDDLDALEAMAKRAYCDVIASGRYSYRALIHAIDELVSKRIRTNKPWHILSVGVGYVRSDLHDDICVTQLAIPRGSTVSWPVAHTCYDYELCQSESVPAQSVPAEVASLDGAVSIVRRAGRLAVRVTPRPLKGLVRGLLHKSARVVGLK